MTSLRTIYASLRLPSGYRATGFSTQSELLPSACMVELPSNPQLGISARVGGCSNAFSRLLPRRSGTGVLPSSQMYSSLYFVIISEGQWVAGTRCPKQFPEKPVRTSVIFVKLRKLESKQQLPRTGQGRSGVLTWKIRVYPQRNPRVQ